MKKNIANTERIVLSSKDFTKKFIISCLFNGLVFGFVFGIIYELIKEFIPDILKTVILFLLLFLIITKVYRSAIKDAFAIGKITKEDINKIKRNITLIFIILFVINLSLDILNYIRIATSVFADLFKSMALSNLIISTITNIVLYTLLIICCRRKFSKECSNPENIA